jgi:3-phenylpropionate/cinnamic acid dioxygenase small subunit
VSGDAFESIRRLLHRYAECIDAADFAGLGALFEHGALSAAGMPAPLRGAEAVAGFYARANRVHADGTLRTKHVVSNEIIELDAGGAAACSRSVFVVYQATARLPLQAIAAGRYHDRFERAAEGWRFADREILLDLAGDLSDHLRIDLRPRDDATR